MESAASELFKQAHRAFGSDDVAEVRRLLAAHPGLKKLVDAPIGPFDSPAIVNARSAAMVDLLLEAGADLNAKSRWWAGGFGLLHLAPPAICAHAIARGAVVDAHAAARLGMIDRLRELVAGDPALVHARGGDGQTPLHFAATVEIADFLLDQGAAIDAVDVDHESTPAQHMLGDRQDVARRLIARGCRTDLLMAAAVGDLDLVRRTLVADPQAIRLRVDDAHFPMSNPRAGGTIYQWTLEAHLTPHGAARKFGRDDVLRLLLERSPPAVALLDACWEGDEAAVNALRAAHPVAAQGFSLADRRLPADAARNNRTVAVRLLLECGLPVDAKGQHGATPLHWAAFHGNAEMAATVLRFAPPLEAIDDDHGSTPLGWAIYGSEHGWRRGTGDYAGAVQALLDAGAAPPAQVAGSAAVQEVLRRRGAGGGSA